MMYAFGKLHTCMINLQLDQYHHYYVIERVCCGRGVDRGDGRMESAWFHLSPQGVCVPNYYTETDRGGKKSQQQIIFGFRKTY